VAAAAAAAVDNWTDEEHERSLVLDTSDASERLSVCLQLVDARQPPDHRAKIVTIHISQNKTQSQRFVSVFIFSYSHLLSVLRHCWLGVRKGIRPIKN